MADDAKPVADAPTEPKSNAVEPVAHVEVTAADAGKDRPATPPATEGKADTDAVASTPAATSADTPAAAASPKTSKRTPRKKKTATADSPAPAGAASTEDDASPDSPAADKTPARRAPRGPRASRGTPRSSSAADASGSPSTEIKRSAVDLRAIVSSREAGTIIGTVKFSLESLDGTRVVTEGVATSTAIYDRSVQRFSSLRAARDAEIRLAKVLADQIRTRIASALTAIKSRT